MLHWGATRRRLRELLRLGVTEFISLPGVEQPNEGARTMMLHLLLQYCP